MARMLPVALILAALAAFFALHFDRYFTLESLRSNRALLQSAVEAHYALALAAFMLAYAAATAISFPGASIWTIFAGFLFGQWIGSGAVIVAATSGAFIIYLAARTSFGKGLRSRAGGFISRMEAGLKENELSYMFLMRLVPMFPFWAVNIAAGLLGVSARNFLIGTFFGMIPGTVVYSSIGRGLGSVFDAGGDPTLSGVLLRPNIIFPILGLAVLAALPIFVKHARSKRNAGP